ncbi:MAG: DUF2007 domain-containing protein [Fimbriimonadaceae bacterium]|nr:DUF2007 domain-containing protein [Chthonomonadaceae bacterium]MCO5296132.1 DUF2007 domain-containing protein [Fimbriimonadaceae bacterium]
MYCPQCRSEFVPGVITCPECDVPLVDALEPLPEEPRPKKLVPLVVTYNPGDAAIVSAFLESRDIEYYLRNDVVDRMYLQLSPIEVMVNEDDLAAGMEALKDLDPRFTKDWEKEE